MVKRRENLTVFCFIINRICCQQRQIALKFIIGSEPLDNFDKYADTCKSMGIDQAIQLTQDAYDAYLAKAMN